MNKAATNIYVQVLSWKYALVFLEEIPTKEIAKSQRRYMSAKHFCQSDCNIVNS